MPSLASRARVVGEAASSSWGACAGAGVGVGAATGICLSTCRSKYPTVSESKFTYRTSCKCPVFIIFGRCFRESSQKQKQKQKQRKEFTNLSSSEMCQSPVQPESESQHTCLSGNGRDLIGYVK